MTEDEKKTTKKTVKKTTKKTTKKATAESGKKGGLRKTLIDLETRSKENSRQITELVNQADVQLKQLSTRISKNDAFLISIDGALQTIANNQRQIQANIQALGGEIDKLKNDVYEQEEELDEIAEIEAEDEKPAGET